MKPLFLFALASLALSASSLAQSSVLITPTVTVSTTPAYSANDSIGGKITILTAVSTAGKGSVLQSIQLIDRANQKPAGTILIFNADPTAATITDNAGFTASTDDLKVIATIPVLTADWTTLGAASKAFANLNGLGRVLRPAAGTTLYAAFVTTSTPTYVATTDLQISFGLLRD